MSKLITPPSGTMTREQHSSTTGIPNRTSEIMVQLRASNFDSHLSDAIHSTATEFSDVRIICGDGYASAHRLLLVAAFPLVAETMNDQMPGSQTCIHLPDISVKVVRLILDFVYSGKVEAPAELQVEFMEAISMLGFELDRTNFKLVVEQKSDGAGACPTNNQLWWTFGLKHELVGEPDVSDYVDDEVVVSGDQFSLSIGDTSSSSDMMIVNVMSLADVITPSDATPVPAGEFFLVDENDDLITDDADDNENAAELHSDENQKTEIVLSNISNNTVNENNKRRPSVLDEDLSDPDEEGGDPVTNEFKRMRPTGEESETGQNGIDGDDEDEDPNDENSGPYYHEIDDSDVEIEECRY